MESYIMSVPNGPTATGFRAAMRSQQTPPPRHLRFKTLMKRKRIRSDQTEIPPQGTSAPAAGSDDPTELKEFVENYLVLADKALGFMRRQGPNQLTISTCVHCQHTIAASNLKLLSFAENLHVCPAKKPTVAGHKDAA